MIEHFRDKAGKTIQTVSPIVGFSLLIFSLTLTLLLAYPGELTGFQEALTMWVLFVQIVAITVFFITLDQLDTSMNKFVTYDEEDRWQITRFYYLKGIRNYYAGLVILVFSALLSTLLVHPLITTGGVIVFTALGYNYWFRYSREDVFDLQNDVGETIDDKETTDDFDGPKDAATETTESSDAAG